MKQIISKKLALNAMIALTTAVLLFHTLILIQIIPYSIVWAGKLNSVEEMRIFEFVSIIINSFMLITFLLKSKYIQNTFSSKILNGIIWFFFVLFGLNTIGNLFAESNFELYFFTTLTFISTLLCLRIVIEKEVD